MRSSRDGAKTVSAAPATLVVMPLASSVVQIPPGVLAAGYCLSISEFWTDGSILPPRRQVIDLARPRRSSGRLWTDLSEHLTLQRYQTDSDIGHSSFEHARYH